MPTLHLKDIGLEADESRLTKDGQFARLPAAIAGGDRHIVVHVPIWGVDAHRIFTTLRTHKAAIESAAAARWDGTRDIYLADFPRC